MELGYCAAYGNWVVLSCCECNDNGQSLVAVKLMIVCFVCLFDLILYVQSTIFQLNRDRSSWV